jgi:uncharacterized protein with PCYCGC motif
MSSVRSLFVAPAGAFAVALLVACGGAPDPAPQAQSTTPPPAASTPAAEPASSSSAPDLRPGLPPLPVTPFPAARPPEIVRAVYTFAADHPEVLSKVPCFCGCENRGHKANDDCFVAGRDTTGRVTAWDAHGLG